MKYKCIIIDDEELARELIETHLSKLDNFELLASCSTALEAHNFLKEDTVDLLFLDIEMPVLKGTDFLKGLKMAPKVIFTTAYRDYAIEGFELNAVDYLLKPIVFERFFKAIEKFIEGEQTKSSESKKEEYIYLQNNKKNIKIILDDVLYIESIKDYIKIHLNENKMMFKYGITSFYEKLDDRFLRVHRSYIINKEKITAYTKNDIEINNIEIPIGNYYKDEVLKCLT